jgi:hypothetical protein
MADRTQERLLATAKYLTEISIDAADYLLGRIESGGVSDLDRKDVETLRRGLRFADEQMEGARYVTAIRTDAELERLAARLRERIALIDAKIAAATQN